MSYGRFGCGFGWRQLLLYLLIVPVIFYFACGGFGY